MVKEIEVIKRQVKTLKGNSLFIYNSLVQRFEDSFVSFDEVKTMVIDRYAKIAADNKEFKTSHKGETNWGYGKQVKHCEHKVASKILKVLERLSPDNITELMAEIEKLQDASFKSGDSAEVEVARNLFHGAINQLNSLLYF
ncbi:hypothetical protein [Solidesulfovibrio carbinolicus]|uniref:Uncharacterized protein n=1 Tax=Solidesulfovibrio carbinolicus TaxID=296842 RepID=A0A4P6HR94_9BACT|nr:hypothetical protein [Solidesulfovibrio carbinolicus]QAZ69685.1 hypothetical protein C3Y92_20630 [Solidesulfovibrio carbinolicus]